MATPTTLKSLRLLMVAGGTGGHIIPALTVADELRARWRRGEARGATGKADSACEIEFLGTGRPLELRLIPAAGYRLRTIKAAGLVGIHGLKKLANLLVLPRSAVGAFEALRDFRPDVVVGVGGYVAGPAMLEAALMGIPTLLIEPNARPGFTNRLLAPVVRVAAVGFEDAAELYGKKARLTGHPVRKAFREVRAREHVPPFTVLVMGGSQGAAAINECLVKAVTLLAQDISARDGTTQLRLIHQTGEADFSKVREAHEKQGVAIDVRPFIDDVPGAFAEADLVVSRAGALSVAEIMAAGRAAVLIPFAAAAEHHQSANARALERAGAAHVIEQSQLTAERLVAEIRNMLAEPRRLVEMEQRARALARPGATEQIADLIERLAGFEATRDGARPAAFER